PSGGRVGGSRRGLLDLVVDPVDVEEGTRVGCGQCCPAGKREEGRGSSQCRQCHRLCEDQRSAPVDRCGCPCDVGYTACLCSAAGNAERPLECAAQVFHGHLEGS